MGYLLTVSSDSQGALCEGRTLWRLCEVERGVFDYLNLCISSFLALPALLQATTATKAMVFNTFSVPQTQGSLQIIHYDGPPKSKRPSQRPPSKIPSSEDGVGSNVERENEEDLTPTLDEVELVDLTCLGTASLQPT